MSAAHDGVQGAALDAAVYDALRPGGVQVHELAAASAAGTPRGGCYSARTLKYLEAHQAAHKKLRPPSPPYLPEAAFRRLSDAEKAQYEMIPPPRQPAPAPAPSAVRRPGLRGCSTAPGEGPEAATLPVPHRRPAPSPHPSFPPPPVPLRLLRPHLSPPACHPPAATQEAKGEAKGIENFVWDEGEKPKASPSRGRGKPRGPVGVASPARSPGRSPGAPGAERPGLVRVQDLVEVALPEEELEAMTRAQRVETMRELAEQHSQLLGMAHNLLQLQARIGRRL